MGSRKIVWFLREGPGIPKDHDFIAGAFVTDSDMTAAREEGFKDAQTQAVAAITAIKPTP